MACVTCGIFVGEAFRVGYDIPGDDTFSKSILLLIFYGAIFGD